MVFCLRGGEMADQIQGYNFTQKTAAATTLLSDRQCIVNNLSVLGTGNGTVFLYNVSTAAGTTAGNNLVTLKLTSPTVPSVLPINANFSDGLVIEVAGTVNVGVSWS